MKVLVVGSGAREHALARKIASSAQVSAVLCAPGNAGTAEIAQNVALDVNDPAAIVAFAREQNVDFVVVGPEAPLVAGAVDALSAAGILAYGPTREAAALEGSKALSKRFMARHGIPTAAFGIFDDPAQAHQYIDAANTKLVVKADGLAAGKGVIVCRDATQAHQAVDSIMVERAFGEAGNTVVIEERLSGQEVSFHVVLDGKRFVALCAAQDHKAIGDGDTGPNTGGMGAYSPPLVVTPEVEQKIVREVVEPSVAGLRADEIDFRGTLFIGLMIVDGAPMVLEYNVRFGDPETQVIMARLAGDVMPLLLGASRGDLSQVSLQWEAPAAMCVVLAAAGYPGNYDKGAIIAGTDAAAALPGVQVLHAGTRLQDGNVVTNGGRVLGVTAIGDTIDEVADLVYRAVNLIHFPGMQYRRDIGHHARTRL